MGPSVVKTRTLTTKVPTPFGNLFAHIEFNGDLRPTEFRISIPGKLAGTPVGDALDELGEAATQMLGELCP